MEQTMSFEEAFQHEDYIKINNFIKESIIKLKTLLENQSLDQLEKETEQKKARFSFLVKKEIVQKNIHFSFGRYIGYIDAICEQLEKEYHKKNLEGCLDSCNISDIPHINDIVLTILQNEGIRHGILAEKVGIEKSTLSGIMDRLVEKGVIKFSRPGKFKYYYLTDLGHTYYNKNKLFFKASTDINALTEQLILALSKEEDANGKLLQIMAALFGGKNFFKGYVSKTQKKVNPTVIFAGIPLIKPINVSLMGNQAYTVNNSVVFGTSNEKSVVYFSYEDDLKNDLEEIDFEEMDFEEMDFEEYHKTTSNELLYVG